MSRVRRLAPVVALWFAGAVAASSGGAYLKRAPPEGEIPFGKVVYVDDGTCPKGQVKEITGGSREKSIPRRSRCVKRPAASN